MSTIVDERPSLDLFVDVVHELLKRPRGGEVSPTHQIAMANLNARAHRSAEDFAEILNEAVMLSAALATRLGKNPDSAANNVRRIADLMHRARCAARARRGAW